MFWRILRKSLLTRKSHFAVAVIAVTMGALLVAATSTISLNIKDKISRELRAYGPNLSLLPMTKIVIISYSFRNIAEKSSLKRLGGKSGKY